MNVKFDRIENISEGKQTRRKKIKGDWNENRPERRRRHRPKKYTASHSQYSPIGVFLFRIRIFGGQFVHRPNLNFYCFLKRAQQHRHHSVALVAFCFTFFVLIISTNRIFRCFQRKRMMSCSHKHKTRTTAMVENEYSLHSQRQVECQRRRKCVFGLGSVTT